MFMDIELSPSKLKLKSSGIENFSWPLNQPRYWAAARELVHEMAQTLRDIDAVNEVDAKPISLLSSYLLVNVTSVLFVRMLEKDTADLGAALRFPKDSPLLRLIFEGTIPNNARMLDILGKGIADTPGSKWPWLRPINELRFRDGFRRRPLALTDLKNHIVTVKHMVSPDQCRECNQSGANSC